MTRRRVAVFGGDDRIFEHEEWGDARVDVRVFPSRKARALISSITSGALDHVVILTKFVGHSDEGRIRAVSGGEVDVRRWSRGIPALAQQMVPFLGLHDLPHPNPPSNHLEVAMGISVNDELRSRPSGLPQEGASNRIDVSKLPPVATFGPFLLPLPTDPKADEIAGRFMARTEPKKKIRGRGLNVDDVLAALDVMGKEGEGWATLKEIAELTGLETKTVQDVLFKLSGRGQVERENEHPRKGMGQRYRRSFVFDVKPRSLPASTSVMKPETKYRVGRALSFQDFDTLELALAEVRRLAALNQTNVPEVWEMRRLQISVKTTVDVEVVGR